MGEVSRAEAKRGTSWSRLGATASILPLLTCLACGESVESSADSSLVTSSDPELASIAVRMLPELASRSGMELHGPVRVERRSRMDLERYLEFKIEEEFPGRRAELLSEVYGLLGLVPTDMDFRATLKGLYLEQIAGFYDPDSTTLFVLDDQPDETIESVLAHELVHAIQDQNTDLHAITDPALSNDRRVAAQAAIEGHATLVMFEFMMQQGSGVLDVADLPDFSASLGPALEAAKTNSPALAGAPLVLQESVLFPYRGGVKFVETLWKERGGRLPPFGTDLPGSTEEILHPEDFARGERGPHLRIELSVEEGWRRLHEDTLGELELGILLETVGGSRASASGWAGDRYVLLEAEDEDGDGAGASAATGDRSLVWFAVWDTEEQRDRFVRELETRLSAFPRPATLTALDIEGFPATQLSLGDVPRATVALGIH